MRYIALRQMAPLHEIVRVFLPLLIIALKLQPPLVVVHIIGVNEKHASSAGERMLDLRDGWHASRH